MTEFLCPKNPKHTLKTTDNDNRFEELTCVSCGSVVYKPKEYSQKIIVPIQSSVDLMPESYTLMEDFQPDIDDEEESFNLMCAETCKRY